MDNRSMAMQLCGNVMNQLQTAILGKEQEIERLLVAVLAGGHILIEDVPGTGKTQLVKSLANTIGGDFRRIQCNPDLLPTDITGVSIYHPAKEQFIFRSGPIHTNVLLVDEINRATTKTQSALLEAMEEGHVTVDGETYSLPDPFILLATQNPIEFEGTYQLPEAQLDRFMMKIKLGYPSAIHEQQLVQHSAHNHPAEQLSALMPIEQLISIRHMVQQVHMDQSVSEYIVQLMRATREHQHTLLGGSPRASISLARAVKAYAFLKQRDYVLPDDVKTLFSSIVSHRLLLNMEARMQELTTDHIIGRILETVLIPVSLQR